MKRLISFLIALAISSGSSFAAGPFSPGQTLTANALNAALAAPAITGGSITGSSINNTPTGLITPSSGAFTTLSATGTVSGAGFTSLFASPPAIGNTTPNSGAFTSLTTTGSAGIGTTPSAWSGGQLAVQLPALGALSGGYDYSTNLSQNAYRVNAGWNYIQTGQYAQLYAQTGGGHLWNIAPAGTSGAAITWTQAMTLGNNGHLVLGTSTDNGTDLLQVNGSIVSATHMGTGSYTVAGLPTASAALAGHFAYVVDAVAPTWHGALTGGGTVGTPVFCNGTAWLAY